LALKPGVTSSWPGVVNMKLEVAEYEIIAFGNEGRKIAMMMNPHVMPSSLIAMSAGSSMAGSSSKHVAKRSHEETDVVAVG
jgi:hypothetical protein